MFTVRIQTEDFDPTQIQGVLQTVQTGALVSFVGTVRGAAGCVLEIEHYPGMTEASIHAMLDQARARFVLQGAAVVHRVGVLPAGARIVVVAAASAHRQDAFAAAEFLMDYLKTQAPFWKKEIDAQGQGHWVDARSSDDAALQRWGIASRNAVATHAPAFLETHRA